MAAVNSPSIRFFVIDGVTDNDTCHGHFGPSGCVVGFFCLCVVVFFGLRRIVPGIVDPAILGNSFRGLLALILEFQDGFFKRLGLRLTVGLSPAGGCSLADNRVQQLRFRWNGACAGQVPQRNAFDNGQSQDDRQQSTAAN